MECGDQGKERDYGCQFVEDEKGGHVRKRRAVKGGERRVEELGSAAEDPLNAGCWRRRFYSGCSSAGQTGK